MCRIVSVSLILLLLSACSQIMADDLDEFRIQDYVPERFLDLRWELRGAIGSDDRERESYVSEGFDYHQEEDFEFNIHHSSIFEWYLYDRRKQSSGRLSYVLNAEWFRRQSVEDEYFNYWWETGRDSANRSSRSTTYDAQVAADYQERDYIFGRAFLLSRLRGQARGVFTPAGSASAHDFRYRYSRDTVRLSETISSSEVYDDRKDIYVELASGLGYGRIEEGRHNSTALTMLHELRSRGILVRSPNRQQITALCDTIFAYRNALPFDFREHRIASLEAITGLLAAESLLVSPNAATVLTLEDIWTYYPTYARRFGQRCELSFGYRGTKWSEQTDTDRSFHIRQSEWVGGANPVLIADSTYATSIYDKRASWNEIWFAEGSVGYYRPLSLRWQWNSDVTGRTNIDKHFSTANFWYEKRRLSAAGQLEYLHDNRTSIGIRAGYRYVLESLALRDEQLPETVRSEQFESTVSGTLRYRVSPMTSFLVSIEYMRNLTKRQDLSIESESLREDVDIYAFMSHYIL